jgi:RsiW-degrading membrane proteinase PrsW (M82 family)
MSHELYAPPKAELDLAPQSGGPRLHSLSAIGVATFFGGPFAAGYLIYRNFIGLGQPRRAKQAIVWFGAGGLAALYVTWHTPADVISFMLSVGIPQLVVVLVATRLMQGQAIAAHRLAGGEMHSNWFALAAGIAIGMSVKALLYGVSYVLV